MVYEFVFLLSLSWLRLDRTQPVLLLVGNSVMLSVNSRCAVTDNSILKELTCDQHFLFRVVYVNAIRGTRFLLFLPPPSFLNCFYHTISIFARNVTEMDLRIEPRPVSMQRAEM